MSIVPVLAAMIAAKQMQEDDKNRNLCTCGHDRKEHNNYKFTPDCTRCNCSRFAPKR